MKCKACGQEKPVVKLKAGDYVRYKSSGPEVFIVTDMTAGEFFNPSWLLVVCLRTGRTIRIPDYTLVRVHGRVCVTSEER